MVAGLALALVVVLAFASPTAAQIVPLPGGDRDADDYQECREDVVDRGGDELDAARSCVPDETAFARCIGTGRVTQADVVRCVDAQVDGAYEDRPSTSTTTEVDDTTTTAPVTTTEPVVNTTVPAAVTDVADEVADGDGDDGGVGVPVVIGVGVVGLVLGALLGAARGRRGSTAADHGPAPVPAVAPVPVAPAADPTAAAERDELVRALIDTADQVTSDAVRTSIVQRLGAVGVEPILVTAGERFDPSVHRGVEAAPASGPEQADTIAALERPGWVDRGRVLRPPEVVVHRWDGGGS